MSTKAQPVAAPPGRKEQSILSAQVLRRETTEPDSIRAAKNHGGPRASFGSAGLAVPRRHSEFCNVPLLSPQSSARLLRQSSITPDSATGELGRVYRAGGGRAAASYVDLQHSGGTPLSPSVARVASQRFGFDLGRVRIHADDHADDLCRQVNADAFTVADNVFFRAGKYAPSHPDGDRLLHHELAHVAQFRQGLLNRPERELESQADRAASGIKAVATTAAVRPAAIAPLLLRQVSEARCTGIEIILPNTIVFHGTQGDFRARVDEGLQLNVGTYEVTYDQKAQELSIPSAAGGIVLRVSGDLRGTKSQIKTQQDRFQAYLESLSANSVPLTVNGVQAAPTGQQGAGKGGGTGGDHGAKAANQDSGAAGGKPGGTGTISGVAPPTGKTGGAGGGTGTSPVIQQGSGGTTVKITDAKQIDELRRRGLLDDKIAADVKDKSDKKEAIPFDELMALYKALSETMVLKAPGKDEPKSDTKQEDWIEVARFIQANRALFSGQQKTGEGGLTLDDMKAILAKYHEFVGVKDPNQAGTQPDEQRTPQDKLEHFDPQKRKSWNSLEPWEKDIWQKYTAKYGQPTNDDPMADLHMTPQMKMSLALHMSPDFVSEGGREAFEQLINDPIFIAGTMIGITLYVAAWLAPEPLFSKATAATITLALLTLFTLSEIKNFAVAWMALSDESEAANSFDELQAAAEHFGKAMGGILLRVLVTITTILVGKALPGPKPIEGGGGGTGAAPESVNSGAGGGLRPATAGGPQITAISQPPAAVTIQVMADGTVVISPVTAATGLNAVAVQNGGGGSGISGGSGSGKGSGPGRDAPPREKLKVKEEAPPEGTQGVKEIRKYSPDIEQQQGVGKQVGNFAHKWFEKLSTFIKSPNVVSEEPPAGSQAEYPVKNPNYSPGRAPRIDRLYRVGHMVIEFKPNGLYEQGLAEAKAYAMEMDKYETLPNGERWQAKCITYDFDLVLDFMESNGYLSPEEVTAFRAKYTPKK